MSKARYLKIATDFISHCKDNRAFAQVASAGTARPVLVDEGRVKVELEVTQEMTNPFGTLHGGCTATLIDIFTTAAVLCSEKSPNAGVSVDLHVSYHAAAKVGETVVLDSVVTKAGKSIAFTKAELFRKHDNVLLASGLHTKAFAFKR